MLILKNPQSVQLMQCLASNDEVKLIVFEKNLNLTHAIEGTKLKKLENTIGEINTITAICYLLNRFNTNFNVGKSLTVTQAALLAADIVEKYPYETIEDVVLMLKQVRQGILGDGKDYKLDGQNILAKWFPEYLDKKYTEVERLNKQENNKTAIDFNSPDHPVNQFYAKKRIEKQRKEREEKVKMEIDEMVKNMDRQMLEDTIVSWEKKPEMKNFMDYLRRKRLEVKGDYKF